MSDYKHILKDLSHIKKDIKIALITWEFNKNLTSELENTTEKLLNDNWFDNIDKYYVPGAFELPAMTSRVLEYKEYDLLYVLGVVIRWATTHYDLVCYETSRGVMEMTLSYDTPIIFGLLTCENENQAKERINNSIAISGLNLLAEIRNKLW